LPVPYFLVTFTVPEPLRGVFGRHPAVMHAALFRESAATLQQVAAERRLLGAELGFVGVLHTWGRQLQHHPHVHYIVPGGGLRSDGRQWMPARQRDWLLPVAKLAAVFRARLEEALRAEAPAEHAMIPAGTWRGRWVVHTQPAGSGEAVVRYLARYVGRTAISDERIVAADDGAVTFRYTDSASQQKKECTLAAAEFLRRYLQHVPPSGQHRVRYFGWLHPSAKARLRRVETLLAKRIIVVASPPEAVKWHLRCPHCERFTLVCVGTFARHARAPPTLAHSSPPRLTHSSPPRCSR
jgi:hypothetical protein